MDDFYKTRMGLTFFQAHVPAIIRALERIATILETKMEGVGIWECEDCNHQTEVTYNDICIIGTPYCSKCNAKGSQREMKLLRIK